MACCLCCCGGQLCDEGQEGKCCCNGDCCQEGEHCCDGVCQSEPCEECSGPCDGENPCPEGCVCVDGECVPSGACCSEGSCSETAEADCFGTWQGAGTSCDPNPCPPPEYPGACCVDGVCQEVDSEAECTALGGIYQGAYTTCDDGDCTDTCCVAAVRDDGCTITICEEGYFSCDNPCADPDDPQQPSTGFTNCQSGTTLDNTVTGSGVVIASGVTPDDYLEFLRDALNDSYAITRDSCDGCNAAALSCEISFALADGPTWEDHFALVQFGNQSSRLATINIVYLGASVVSMSRNDGTRTSISSSCGAALYDCDEGVSGAPDTTGGSFGSYFDFSSADLTTS